MKLLKEKDKKKVKKLTMKKADEIFSLWIRTRDGFKCQMCGRTKEQGYSIQNSHFWGRGNKTVRYDPENCDALCGSCHMNNEGSKQGYYRDWKINQLGRERYDLLEKRARSMGKLSDILADFDFNRKDDIII